MDNNLLEKLLSESARDIRRDVENKIKVLRFQKGASIFHQGDNVSHVFVLQKGLVKLTYLTAAGKELVKSFLQEGDILGSLVCQLSNGPSSFSAVCLEEVECLQLPYTELESLIQQHPQGPILAMHFFRQLALKKEIREYEFLCLPVEQRYENFLAEFGPLAARIKQQELARYLGITPVALSRIKNRQL